MPGSVEINLSAEEIGDILKAMTGPTRDQAGQSADAAAGDAAPAAKALGPVVPACGIAICGNGTREM